MLTEVGSERELNVNGDGEMQCLLLMGVDTADVVVGVWVVSSVEQGRWKRQ